MDIRMAAWATWIAWREGTRPGIPTRTEAATCLICCPWSGQYDWRWDDLDGCSSSGCLSHFPIYDSWIPPLGVWSSWSKVGSWRLAVVETERSEERMTREDVVQVLKRLKLAGCYYSVLWYVPACTLLSHGPRKIRESMLLQYSVWLLCQWPFVSAKSYSARLPAPPCDVGYPGQTPRALRVKIRQDQERLRFSHLAANIYSTHLPLLKAFSAISRK